MNTKIFHCKHCGRIKRESSKAQSAFGNGCKVSPAGIHFYVANAR